MKLRIQIALAILRGKESGFYGPKEACPEHTLKDGSPAIMRASWQLEFNSKWTNCPGSLRKEEENGNRTE